MKNRVWQLIKIIKNVLWTHFGTEEESFFSKAKTNYSDIMYVINPLQMQRGINSIFSDITHPLVTEND